MNRSIAVRRLVAISSSSVSSSSGSCCNYATLSSPKTSKTIDDNNNKKQQSRLADLLPEPKLASTATQQQRRGPAQVVISRELKFYDPPYIKFEPPFPNYSVLTLNFKGYDYSSLEHFYKYAEKLCLSLKLEVAEAYPMPARSYNIKTFKPFSTSLDQEVTLQIYHRCVKVLNLKSTMAPLLFEIIQLNLPEGVQFSVNKPDQEQDEFRYVPDVELKALREKYAELSGEAPATPAPAAAAAKKPPVPPTTSTTTTPAVKK